MMNEDQRPTHRESPLEFYVRDSITAHRYGESNKVVMIDHPALAALYNLDERQHHLAPVITECPE
jgi:hypothetical protein